MIHRLSSLGAVFSIAAFLQACTTTAEQKAEQMQTSLRAGRDAEGICQAEVNQDPKYQPLNKVFDLNQNFSIEQMASTSVPTVSEAKLLSQWADRMKDCRKIGLNSVAQNTPSVVMSLTDAYNREYMVMVELIQRKISWGEGIKRLMEVRSSGLKDVTQAANQVSQSLALEHNAELARRQAAADALARTGQMLQQQANQQQLVNTLNRPRTTNCNAFGNSATCTTY